MSNNTTCNCEQCPPAGCGCGCQAPRTDRRSACGCGNPCACGRDCECGAA